MPDGHDPVEALLALATVRVEGNDKGSGFFIAPEYVLTAAHVVGSARRPDDGGPEIFIGLNDKRRSATLTDISPEHDVALLRAKAGGEIAVLLADDVILG